MSGLGLSGRGRVGPQAIDSGCEAGLGSSSRVGVDDALCSGPIEKFTGLSEFFLSPCQVTRCDGLTDLSTLRPCRTLDRTIVETTLDVLT